ncbi:MAG: hypothetical protein OSB09_11495 [Planctomycetota bacterium]|nr:hypothetical protein [Planctomycetota bacterium]
MTDPDHEESETDPPHPPEWQVVGDITAAEKCSLRDRSWEHINGHK